MPKSKTQKRLEVLEKLEGKLKEMSNSKKRDFPLAIFPSTREVSLLIQIDNLRAKLQMSPYKGDGL